MWTDLLCFRSLWMPSVLILSPLQVTRRDVSCSLTSTHFCASRYSDVWIALVLGCKVGNHIFLDYSLSLTKWIVCKEVTRIKRWFILKYIEIRDVYWRNNFPNSLDTVIQFFPKSYKFTYCFYHFLCVCFFHLLKIPVFSLNLL